MAPTLPVQPTYDSTVTGKNQITIPADIARSMGIEPGVRFEWKVQPDGQTILLRRKLSRAEIVAKVAGIGRDWIKPGDDPIGDLIRNRVAEEPS